MSLQQSPLFVGLGDPVMDILAHVSPQYLSTVTKEPGGCFSIPPHEMDVMLKRAEAEACELKRMPGGSAANVVKGIANIMGKDVRATFVGMVGNDSTGAQYKERLEAQGVNPVLLVSKSGAPSACSLCLVTPDGQRTMRTCLGASLELQSASQLQTADWCPPGLRMLHCEGYCLYRPCLAKEMMLAAKTQGAIVSMDLASFELVRNCKTSLLDLLTSKCLDMVFANHEEAAELSIDLGLSPAAASHDEKVAAAQDFLLQHVQVSVVSRGPLGCTARNAAGVTAAAPAAHVPVVDTIGAGDFFTAGFLSAYLRGATLQHCAEAGCAAGAEAVQVQGAELSPATWAKLRVQIKSLLSDTTSGGQWNLRSFWYSNYESNTLLFIGVPLCLLGLGLLGSHVVRRLSTK